MRSHRVFAAMSLVVFCGALEAQVPTPVLNSISPTATTTGAAPFTLTVNGSNFVADGVSRVNFRDTLLIPFLATPTQLLVTVDSALLVPAGTVNVQVFNRTVPSAAVRTFTINPAPVIQPTSLAVGTVGVPYSQALTATLGTPPYSNWRVSGGSLPPGLTLSPAGVISGTPAGVDAGRVQISVNDSAGVTAVQAFGWRVYPALTITTSSPLPNGVLGAAYSQTLAVTGGQAPYTWLIASGAPPRGLSLSTAGVLAGNPAEIGPFSFSVRVSDALGVIGTKAFTLNIVQSGITQGPDGEVGVAYQATLVALSGTGPWTWSISGGQLPPGVVLDAKTGVLSGTPTAAGTYSFVAVWRDSQGVTFPNSYDIHIYPALALAASPLPAAVVGAAYTQQLGSGGRPPYSASVSGSVPAGLTFDAPTLVLSGTPTSPGTSVFTVAAGDGLQTLTRQFSLTVNPLPAPAVSVTGLPDAANPAQQPAFDVQLGSPYALAITGRARLDFVPDAVVPSDDPSIQFSTGGRTVNFTIPAGQTRATFPTSTPAIQTGTVAGRIILTIDQLLAGGQNITPTPAPSRTVQIARSAPRINSVQVVRTGSGFNLLITGYSTPREVTQAVFTFTAAAGGNLATTSLTVPVSAAFTTWYGGANSGQFGSSFLYTQPFQVQGTIGAIGSVSVVLSNSAGTSQPASANF